MNPIEILMNEHQIILSVCDSSDRESARLSRGGAVDARRVETILDFIRSFADRFHHAKEEDLLFARMAERGFPVEGGPIGMMLREHEIGRGHVAGIAGDLPRAAAGDASARTVAAENLGGWAALLRQHIFKEDNILYPMAVRMLTPADMKALEEDFARVAREFGEGFHARYASVARELAEAAAA